MNATFAKQSSAPLERFMSPFAVLEIKLSTGEQCRFDIQLVFHRGDCDTEARLTRGHAFFEIDFEALDLLRADPLAYGLALSRMVFSDPRVRSGFAAGRAKASALDMPLHIRLHVEPEAAQLQQLYWETLCDPEEERPLFRGERVSFTRHLSGYDWRPVQFKSEENFKALVTISSPKNLADYNLAPIDTEAERLQATQGLAGIPTNVLASGGHANLNAVIEEMRAGYDIFYLVCHGMIKDGASWLWLENKVGQTMRVKGSDLANRISELHQLPRLIILISCQSGGSDEQRFSFSSALGPRLAEAGVPAVLAMQGRISFETTAEFMPAFFKELRRSGHLGKAMAVARGTVRDKPDWWMPMLFTRLKSGQLWHRNSAAEHHSVETQALHGQGLARISEETPTQTAQVLEPPPAPSSQRPPIEALVNPILTSVVSVFKKFLQLEVTRKDVRLQKISSALYDLTTEITFRAEHFEGSLFMCLKEETLLPLIGKAFGHTPAEITADGKDLIGEITNMIIGNAKGSLPPSHHLRVSTPTLICGKEHMVSVFSQYTVLRISFDSAVGPFDVNLYVDGIHTRLEKEGTEVNKFKGFTFKPEVVDPLLDSCERIFHNFLGLDIRKKGVTMKEELTPKFELSGILNVFTMDIRGKILLNLSNKLALAVHEKLLGETLETVDENVQDTVCELVNIITGNAKKEYSKQGLLYRLSVPYAIRGRNQIISSSGHDPFISSMYWTDKGFFEICISFQENRNLK